MHLTPGIVLAALGVLLVAQVTRLVAGRGPYLVTLLLAAAGMAGGEALAAGGHLGAGMLGTLHPLLDLPLMAGLEVAGAVMLGRPAVGRG